jgi:hypothetical protein
MQNILTNENLVVAVGVPQMKVTDLVLGLAKEKSQVVEVVELNSQSQTGVKEVDHEIDELFKIMNTVTKGAFMVEGSVVVKRINFFQYRVEVKFNSLHITEEGFEVNEGELNSNVTLLPFI